MDLSIIYSIFYNPRGTLRKFIRKTRMEAFIFVLILTFVHPIRTTGLWYPVLRQESVSLLELFVAISYNLLFPIVFWLGLPMLDSLYLFFLARRISNVSATFGSLFTAFLICEVPYLLGSLLTRNYFLGFRLGSLFPLLMPNSKFLYGMLAEVSPFYLWMVFLWWVALDVLLELRPIQRAILLSSLVLVDRLGNGALNAILPYFVI